MKKIILVLLVFFISSTLSAQMKKINIENSQIFWSGKKITGEHHGTIHFNEGTLFFKNNKIIGGTFTANMNSLTNTDQLGKDKAQLENYLKSEDFFDVTNFKTATLIIKAITKKKKNRYAVSADLTIKGKTNLVKFDLAMKGKTATAFLKIDRTKYGVQYGTGSLFDDIADRTIYDEFDLNINLKF